MKYLVLILFLLPSCVATPAEVAAISGEVAALTQTFADQYDEMAAGVEALGEKTEEGPSGWLELVGTIGAVVLAGGTGLTMHRNGTRKAGKYLGPGDTVPPQAGE